MNLITIDPEQIEVLAEEGGKIMMKQSAEESLVKLLNVYKHLGEVIELVKDRVVEMGLSIDGGFQGFVGENITGSYRPFGEKYGYSDLEKAKPFTKEKIYIKVDSATVEAYKKKHGKLPEGVFENDRTKSLVFSVGEP